jgi:hypothetical protein
LPVCRISCIVPSASSFHCSLLLDLNVHKIKMKTFVARQRPRSTIAFVCLFIALQLIIRNLTFDFPGKIPQRKAETKTSQSRTIEPHQHISNVTINPKHVLLIGVEKGGTSAVADALSSMKSHVCLPTKEPHYFDIPSFHKNRTYEQLYEHCKQPLRLDATPTSFAMPKRIYSYFERNGGLEGLLIMLSLREPISRDLSQYNMHVNLCLNKMLSGKGAQWCRNAIRNHTGEVQTYQEAGVRTFSEWLTMLTFKNCQTPEKVAEGYSGWCRGYYAPYVREWFRLFGRERILVLSYQELNRNPDSYMSRVKEFLEIPSLTNHTLQETLTLASSYKLSVPDCVAQSRLEELYRPSNEALFNLLKVPGPTMEQQPFPTFQPGRCTDKTRRH